MKWALLAMLLAGCDLLFLQENAPPPGSGRCGPEYAGGIYVVVAQRQTWQDAERTCRELEGEFSHLAVVGSAVEQLDIAALIGGSEPWVGLTRLGEPRDVFHWITREAAPVEFLTGQPDGDGACGRFSTSGGLADTPCDEQRAAVCECDDFPVDEDRF